jgi:F-type H+-transporting ATPase subunit delta
MTDSAVATRYARALVDALLSPSPRATAPPEPERVIEDLRGFEKALSDSRELRNVLLRPGVPMARKRAVIGKIVDAMGGTKIVRNFLYVLVDHRRISDFSNIIQAFEHIMDVRLGILQVEVRAARPLSDQQSQLLTSGLEKATGKRVWLNTTTDPSLIGGVVARVGSTVFDGSVRGRLDALERRLREG